MRDLGVLKDRIEFAERHLKAAKTARKRESDALMDMWHQIRERFENQEQEIAQYRVQLAEMTQVNDELSTLVDRLIASVEGSVNDSDTEAVPEVAREAKELLKSGPDRQTPEAPKTVDQPPEPAAAPKPRPQAAPAKVAPATDIDTTVAALEALETDDPLELGTSIDDPPRTETSFRSMLNDTMGEDDADYDDDDDFDVDMPEPVTEDSASSGIRNLVSRIEGSVSRPVSGSGRDAYDEDDADYDDYDDDDGDDELTRELQEIEKLRNELSGLRDKISAGR